MEFQVDPTKTVEEHIKDLSDVVGSVSSGAGWGTHAPETFDDWRRDAIAAGVAAECCDVVIDAVRRAKFMR